MPALIRDAEAETPLATVSVSSGSPTGVKIDLPPIPGSDPAAYYTYYKFEVNGTFIYDSVSIANIADAECTKFGSPAGSIDPTWAEDRWGAKTQDPTDDLYDLYVEGKPVDWQPSGGEANCATEDNVYEKTFTASDFVADFTGRKKASFRVYDENYANNADLSGGLVVRIFRGAEPGQGPDDRFIETVTVNTRERAGASTISGLVAGEAYRLVVRGSYSYSFTNDGWFADAECSVTGRSDPQVVYDPVWKAQRTFVAGDSRDFLDLLVNGSEVSWTPLIETTPGCNERDHSYKYGFQPLTSNRVNFTVQSPNHAYNAGLIYVDVYLTRSQNSPPPNPTGIVDAGVAEENRQPSTANPLLTFTVAATSRTPKEISLPGQIQPNGSVKYYTNYRFEVSGKYIWDFNDPGNVADAECSRFARGRAGTTSAAVPDPTWQQNRYGVTKFAEGGGQQKDVTQDPLDLYVNGKDVEWTPLVTDGKGCNSDNNTYDYIMPLSTSRKVQFSVYEPISNQARVADTRNISDADRTNDYSFTVRVFAAPEARSNGDEHVFLETIKVETTKAAGASSVRALVAGQDYRFVVSNFYTYEYRLPAQNLADAECAITPSDPVWQPQRTYPGVPAHDDLYGLYLDQVDVDWVPLFDSGLGCNTTSDHSYRLNHTAKRTSTVNFAVKAKTYHTNAGSLFVDVYLVRPTPASEPPPLPVDDSARANLFSEKEPSTETPMEVIKVLAASQKGSDSLKNYRALQNYRIEVSGIYVYDYRYTLGNRADAECTQFALNGRRAANDGRLDFTVNESSWQSKRYVADQRSPGRDPFDLEVDGAQVDWAPLTADSNFPQCNTKDHTYEYVFTPMFDIDASVKPLNFKVFDVMYQNAFAAGELTVKVFPAGLARSGPDDLAVESLTVDASNPEGTKTRHPLVAGQKYRVVADGIYLYDRRRQEAKADPECTTTDTYPSTDPVFKAKRNWDGISATDDVFDLTINNHQFEWGPLFDSGGGCNARDHAYALAFEPTTTDFARFSVRHTLPSVASGTLKVTIYRVGASRAVSDLPKPESIPSGESIKGTPLAITTVSARPGAFTDILLPGFTTQAAETRYYSYYRIEVNGTYIYNKDIQGNVGDAECTTANLKPTSTPTTVQDSTWQPNRYPLGAFPVGNTNASQANPSGDALDLYVDNRPIEWVPRTADAASPKCNSRDHAYQTLHRNPSGPNATRLVRFQVSDPFNAGTKNLDSNLTYSFTVKIYPGAEPVSSTSDVLVQSITVDPANAKGAFSVPLAKGQRYRFVVDGVYAWDKRVAGDVADAECSSMDSDPAYRARRSWNNGAVAEGVELLDLVMNEREIAWVPLSDPTGSGCNTVDHTYRHSYTPDQNESVTFRVKHPYPSVASGTLRVRVYLASA
ncbi:MAG: hypothetical protein ABIS18_00945 [Actinomycetota bacterium]